MREVGVRRNKNGSFEGYGTIHNKRGDALKYSFTRATKDEVLDIKAKIRLLGIVDSNVIKIKVNKYTNEIELIKNGQNRRLNMKLNKDMLVKDYIDYFLFEHRKKGVNGVKVEDTTFAGYVDRCKYISEFIGEIRVAELTYKDMEYCIDKLQEEMKADSTCRQVRDLLVSMVYFARKDGLLEEDIMQGEKLTLKQRKGKVKKEIIQSEDIEIFRNYCEQHKYYDLLMLLYTGMRSSEMAGLTWKDWNSKERVIDINKAYKRVKKIEMINGKRTVTMVKDFKELKSKASYRKLGVTEEFAKILEQHKEEQKKLAKKNNKEFKETDWIFTTGTYNGYVNDYISDRLKKVLNIIKIKNFDKLTVHCLRHTYCSIAIENGLNIKQVQLILGHSNVRSNL